MKILIVYGTRHGTTKICAEKVKDGVQMDADIIHLEKGTHYDLSPYNMVILGSPIYAGSLLKEVTYFLKTHSADLTTKRIGLFICCITPIREAEKYLTGLFPSDFVSKACVKGIFGGVFDFKKMSGIERFMIRKIKKVKTDMSTLSDENIALFARTVREVCQKT